MSESGKADQVVLRVVHPRVALVFDFDETLAPKTTDVLLEHLGVDPERFETEWHVPFEQLIFVGEGDSDLSAFDFMESHAGMAIAVRQATAGSWESRGDMREGRQVASLVESDFGVGSPLLTALCAAAQRAALWIRTLRTAGRS